MSLTVLAIVERASTLLQDIGAIRYTQADLVKYTSDAQRRIVTVKPDAAAVTLQVMLSPGSRQTLPAGYTGLSTVLCNSLTDTSERKSAIRPIDRSVLDHENPDWHYKPTARLVEHYVYEPDINPLVWYCYPSPANVGQQSVELVLIADPPELVLGDTLTINPRYHEPVIDYVVARAVMRDSEFGDKQNAAQFHAQLFWQGIIPGVKTNATL